MVLQGRISQSGLFMYEDYWPGIVTFSTFPVFSGYEVILYTIEWQSRHYLCHYCLSTILHSTELLGVKWFGIAVRTHTTGICTVEPFLRVWYACYSSHCVWCTSFCVPVTSIGIFLPRPWVCSFCSAYCVHMLSSSLSIVHILFVQGFVRGLCLSNVHIHFRTRFFPYLSHVR